MKATAGAPWERDRERLSAERKRSRQADPEKSRAWSRKTYAKYRNKNHERGRRYYVENLEKERARRRLYYEENREAFAARSRKRRAQVRGGGGTHTAADLFWIEEAQLCSCYYCGVPLPLEPAVHVDHKLPLSRGGSNGRENLALACAPCNLQKSTKTAEEFMEIKQRELSARVAELRRQQNAGKEVRQSK